jgi:hydrogenase maturation protease
VTAVVICVGNAYRGDDAVALAVGERLRRHGVPVVCVEEASRIVDALAGGEVALVVDAAAAGAPPGTVHRYDASEKPLPARVFRGSTHTFGVGEAIELVRALGGLPQRVLVYAVEGEDFRAGTCLSAAVAAAVEPLVAELLGEARCTSVR